MLTGVVPFRGDSAVTVALKHVNEMAAEPASWCRGCRTRSTRSCSRPSPRTPAQRYQTAEEFARDLRSAQQGGPVGAAAFDMDAERTSVMAGAATSATAMLPAQTPLDEVTADRRRRSRWPIVLVIVLLLIIAAAAFGIYHLVGGTSVAVPSVVGRSQAAAQSALTAKGFKTTVEHEYSDRFAAGYVSRQSPNGGQKLRKGGTVTCGSARAPPR